MIHVFNLIAILLMVIGSFTVVKSLRELWRTRKDDRHDIDTSDTGAF